MKSFLVLFLSALALHLCYCQNSKYLSPFRDVEIFKSPSCASGLHFRVPLNGKCQQIPEWIHEENWNFGVMVPKDLNVRFYSDNSCTETMEVSANDNFIPDASRVPSDCLNGDVGGFLQARSLRQVTHVFNKK